MSFKYNDRFQDENGRIFIFFTQETAMEMLNCAKEKITKIFKELEDIGLIKRKRHGFDDLYAWVRSEEISVDETIGTENTSDIEVSETEETDDTDNTTTTVTTTVEETESKTATTTTYGKKEQLKKQIEEFERQLEERGMTIDDLSCTIDEVQYALTQANSHILYH